MEEMIVEGGVLADLLAKHTDPLEFATEVLGMLRTGKLTLNTRGASNTRELIKLFYAHKAKKKSASGSAIKEAHRAPSFKSYLKEQKINKFLTHLEDAMYTQGYSGLMSSLCVLDGVIDRLSGNSKAATSLTSKAYGCVHEDTILMTTRGEMTIKEFHERFNSGEDISVMGRDLDDSLDIMTDVHRSVASEGNKDWVEVVVESGESIKLTADHEVHTTNRGWVKAGELGPGDDITELQ